MSQKYSNHNLNQVIFQIKFYPILKLYSNNPEVASDFQQIVIKEFPELNFKHNKTIHLKIDSTGSPKEEGNNPNLIWCFKNENGKFIDLSNEKLSLIYPGNVYSTFDLFLKDIKLALKGLKSYNLPKIKSIGLRYINQIDATDELTLEKYINSKLRLLNSDSENEKIIQSLSKIEYDIDNFYMSFQYGLFNPNFPDSSAKKDFVLDYDCILNNVHEKNLENSLLKMNKLIYNKFENSIKNELRVKMGGKSRD